MNPLHTSSPSFPPPASRRRFLSGAVAALGGVLLSAPAKGQQRRRSGEGFDYIVVGAGSAGCVIARRLSEDESATVLLLEAGGIDDMPEIHDPRKWGALLNSEVDWKHATEPEKLLNQRRIGWPRGKVLGGSSSINAMIYIRGHRLDFDRWEGLGNEGWGYDSVLPYFKKSEDNSRGASKYHGAGGPLSVADHPEPCEFVPAMIESAKLAGYGGDEKWDFNGAQQEKVAGPYQFTIKDRQRHSTAVAFLKPAMGRSNLTVQTNSLVTRLLFEGGRVTGVEAVTDGKRRQITASHEVILCAGAINSPQLLMLSGVGPPDHLRSHRITVRAALPGVGENLQDHPNVLLGHRSRIDHPAGHTFAVDGGLFVRSPGQPAAASPDVQFMGLQSEGTVLGKEPPRVPLWSLVVTMTQPQSRGTIRLRAADPTQRPLIKANYLAAEADRQALLFGLDLARKLARQGPLREISDGELAPGVEVRSQRALADYLSSNVGTTYHPVGTCKMGRDAMAVVDARLRVRGVAGLRVADASVMPVITNGNTNAPTIMIAEKAADMIKEANA